MKALYSQLEYELQRFDAKPRNIETLFIGGGTPSTVSPKLYEPIFTLLKPYMAKDIEITSEANPNSATSEWLYGMYQLGVNRISFGVQSFDDKKLKLLNRAHSGEQAKEAILNAEKTGFKNISLDLIYATLGDTKELLSHDLKTAFSLPINHISAYALTIEEGTAFASKPQMSKETLKITSWLFKEIKKQNFKQYEISNFGRYQSKHNLGYWLYKDYIGVGSGAVGKLNAERFYPNTILEEYIKNPFEIKVETLSKEEIKMEQIFLGFRSCIGVKSELLNISEQKRAQLLVDENKLQFSNNIFYNSNYLLADEITLFLSS
jgi:oxygen-independent coproporphyrinogen-3 oxidase